MSSLHHLREVEDGGSEVCWTCQTAGEGQGDGMSWWIAASTIPGIILLPADTLLSHQVRPRALDTRRHGWLMVVNHYLILSGSLYHLAIVADAILRLWQFFTIEVMAYIARLDGTDAQLLIPSESLIHLLLQ